MATASPEMKQIALALSQVVEEIRNLVSKVNIVDNKVDNLSLEVKALSQEMNQNVVKHNSELNDFKKEIEEINATGMKTDEQLGKIIFKIGKHEERLSFLEEENRKYNILIRGIQEQKPDELKKRIIDWLKDSEIIELAVTDLVNAFRIGYRRRDLNRNVLVKFANLSDKLEIISKLRDLGEPPKFEGKIIQVFPDISREEREWRYYLKPITKVLRDKGIKYNWRFSQQLKFFYQNKMQTITAQTDAVEYLRELGLIEREEDTSEIKNQLLKMGGIYTESLTLEEKEDTEAIKGKKRKEISPVAMEQKKSRGQKEELKADDSDKKEAEYRDDSSSLSPSLSALTAFLSGNSK